MTTRSDEAAPLSSSSRVTIDHPFEPFDSGDVEKSIPERFESQVAQHAGHLAVEAGKTAMSYAELDEQANRVANALLEKQGRGRGSVGLLLEHGIPMVVSILGVLKAGKTYVPLHRRHPESRLSQILNDCQATSVIVGANDSAVVQSLRHSGPELYPFEALRSHHDRSRPDVEILPTSFASAMYTSGSTGQPKGVWQKHRNILHSVRNYTNGIHISSADRLSLLADFSFAASISAIFGSLLNGATLMPFDLMQEGLHRLARWLEEKRVTVYHSVPTVFRNLVATLPAGQLDEDEEERQEPGP